MPANYSERELIRFLQTYGYNLLKSVAAIEIHFQWKIRELPCKLTTNAIKLIVRMKYVTVK